MGDIQENALEQKRLEALEKMEKNGITPRAKRECIPLFCEQDVNLTELANALRAHGMELRQDKRDRWKLVIARAAPN